MIIRTTEPPKKAVKWVAFSCPHAPLQDKSAIELVCEAVRDFRPDQIICLGDLHEAKSASRWPDEYDWDFAYELSEASKLLRQIRESFPPQPAKTPKCIFLPGNHDDNVLAINRHPKDTRRLLAWDVPQFTKSTNKSRPRQINAEFIDNWRQVCHYRYERRGTYRIGSTVFAHGYEAGVNGDEFQAIGLGWPNGLFVSGHTHRPTAGAPRQAMRTKTLPLPYWYLNAGCTRKLDCDYMHRKRQTLWGHGVVYGWSLPINAPRMQPNTWDAYCQPGRMFESNVLPVQFRQEAQKLAA